MASASINMIGGSCITYYTHSKEKKHLQCDEEIALQKLFDVLTCGICNDLYEKPIQTRCCERVICFHCYTQLDDSNPKACPFDRHKFSGNATRDLVQSGRLINALLNDTVAGIDYSEVEMTDEQKEKIDRYFTTYKELSPSTHVATDQQEASIHSLENDTDTLDQADELFFDMLHFDDSLPNFRFSRQNYRYYVDTLRKLDVYTDKEDVRISGKEYSSSTITIRTDRSPICVDDHISIQTNSRSISLHIPPNFNARISIFTNLGNISSNNYKIQSAGKITSITGTIDVRVDGTKVRVDASTDQGEIFNSVTGRPPAGAQDNVLQLRSRLGSITVSD